MPALARARASSAPQKGDLTIRSGLLSCFVPVPELAAPRSRTLPPTPRTLLLPPCSSSPALRPCSFLPAPCPLIFAPHPAAFTGKRHSMHSTCKRGTKNVPFGPKPFRVYKKLLQHRPPSVNAAYPPTVPRGPFAVQWPRAVRREPRCQAKIIFLFAKFIWHFEKFTYLCDRNN